MTPKPQSKSLRGGTVRLTLSAKVANDIGALRSGLKDLADRLGHSACATGCDVLHIGLEREFVISQEAQLNPSHSLHSGSYVLSKKIDRFPSTQYHVSCRRPAWTISRT